MTATALRTRYIGLLYMTAVWQGEGVRFVEEDNDSRPSDYPCIERG